MDCTRFDSARLEPGSRVLVRSDLNVPIGNGEIANDRRIRAAIPTLQELCNAGAALIVCAHLDRPGGSVDPQHSLRPVARRLGELLETAVALGPDEVVGDETAAMARDVQPGEVMLLENLRFHPGERDTDPDFIDQLCVLADRYVNDAFATCHRSHASMVGPTRRLPSAAGELVCREVKTFRRLRDSDERPFIGVLGGAKVADKLEVVESLTERCDRVLIGGAMSLTFLAATGHDVGSSKVEEDQLDRCRRLMDSGRIELPTDLVAAESLDAGSDHRTVGIDDVPDGWLGADVGPQTADRFAAAVENAGRVFWNGPLGAFEIDAFAEGSRTLAGALAATSAFTVVGGGDTGAAVDSFGLANQIDHLSTGGGAALELVASGHLVALDRLTEADPW